MLLPVIWDVLKLLVLKLWFSSQFFNLGKRWITQLYARYSDMPHVNSPRHCWATLLSDFHLFSELKNCLGRVSKQPSGPPHITSRNIPWWENWKNWPLMWQMLESLQRLCITVGMYVHNFRNNLFCSLLLSFFNYPLEVEKKNDRNRYASILGLLHKQLSIP